MAIMDQVLAEAFNVVARSTENEGPTPVLAARQQQSSPRDSGRNQSVTRQENNTVAAPEITGAPAPTQSRWRNPLGGLRLLGRNQNAEQANATSEPSPAQLEAGTANTTTVR